MNWLLGVVLIILCFFVFKGYRDGFIKTLFSITAALLALVLSVAISPYVSKALQNNEKIYSYVSDQVRTVVKIDKDSDSKTEQIEAIDELKLPKSLKSALKENNNAEVYKALATKKFGDYVTNYITCVVISAISLIGVFIIVNLALFIISRVLDLISKLPLLNGLNKTAGLLVGLLQGFLVIWILCIVLTIFSATEVGQTIYGYINSSRILSIIYDNNLLLRMVTNIGKVLF